MLISFGPTVASGVGLLVGVAALGAGIGALGALTCQESHKTRKWEKLNKQKHHCDRQSTYIYNLYTLL